MATTLWLGMARKTLNILSLRTIIFELVSQLLHHRGKASVMHADMNSPWEADQMIANVLLGQAVQHVGTIFVHHLHSFYILLASWPCLGRAATVSLQHWQHVVLVFMRMVMMIAGRSGLGQHIAARPSSRRCKASLVMASSASCPWPQVQDSIRPQNSGITRICQKSFIWPCPQHHIPRLSASNALSLSRNLRIA